jgi:UTP--glucose-1-phosphate uridylyltransferase
MKITKAVITAAGKDQHHLPLQTLIDRDGKEKSVLQILVEETISGGIEEICVVVQPGDESAYSEIVGDHAGRMHFEVQKEPLGYGQAVYCAKDFTQNDSFLHLVGDHLYVSRQKKSCSRQLIEVAEAEACAVSSVQATRENLLSYFGAIGGRRIHARQDLYRIETVVEKPTPTDAEQRLIIPGLRAGYYLCFFGMHVLTPTIMDILAQLIQEADGSRKVSLSDALNRLAEREQYLAFGKSDLRYDLGVKYGLLTAQVAMALSGKDRDVVLENLLELLYIRELGAGKKEIG